MNTCNTCKILIIPHKSYCESCLKIKKVESQKRRNQKKDKSKRTKYVKNNPGLRQFLIQRQRIIVSRPNNPTKLKTKDIIGCDHHFLKLHIESQFKEGMTWDNYGIKTWHVDHIKPVSLFNLNNDDELKECFNYKNLQPLWAKDNLRKRNRY